MKKNKLYIGEVDWSNLPLAEQLEEIRKHLCTGPCGQSSQVMQQRSRIDSTLRQAIGQLNATMSTAKTKTAEAVARWERTR